MRYLSVCSGVEAATMAWHGLGWQPVAFSEIEKFPSAVLAHHYPTTPNWGDMTKFQEWPDATVDVLCGGTPCQSFSVAGMRKGLADPRGNLMLTFGAIAGRYRPRWLVWENVPGVLSSNGGRDFGTFLGMLGELGYGFAYRVLDAQFVRTCDHPRAVPQRRRRVFVVGYLGDWTRAAAVLFDRESLSGHPPPRREAGQGVAPTISARPTGGGGLGTDFDLDGGLIANSGEVGYCLTASAQQSLDAETETLIAVAHALRGEGFDASEDGTGRGTPIIPVASFAHQAGGKQTTLGWSDDGACQTVAAHQTPAIAIQERAVAENPASGPDGADIRTDGAAYTLEARQQVQAVAFTSMEIRNADAYEADASSALSTLRAKVGTEAYAEWGLAILAAFQSPEVLRAWLHGASLRGQTEEVRSRLDDSALSRAEGSAAGKVLRALWECGPDGRSPQGRGLAKQLAGKPGAALSVLPHEGTPEEADLQFVRQAREGARILRQTLSEVQEVGRPAGGEGQSKHAHWVVRRLTPKEAERLMGFPDDFTKIPYRGKPAGQCPDGPRYKALGNSWAVNAASWIGERIEEVDAWK